MNNCEQAIETVNLWLMPHEGRLLFEFLEVLEGQTDSDSDAAVLDAVLDKLSDANFLALWLREHVRLDLQFDEAAWVQNAIESRLKTWRDQPEQTRAALTAIRDTLNGHGLACLSTQR
jgi:hypothetical protein